MLVKRSGLLTEKSSLSITPCFFVYAAKRPID